MPQPLQIRAGWESDLDDLDLDESMTPAKASNASEVVENWEAALLSAQKEAEALSEAVVELERKLQSSEERCVSLSASAARAEEAVVEVAGLKASMKEMESSAEAADAWMESAQKKISEMEGELENSCQESESARFNLIEKERLETEMSQLASTAAESEGKLYSEIGQLKDDIIAKDAHIDQLKDDLISKDAEVLILVDDLKKAKEVEPQVAPYTSLWEEIKELKATIKEIESNNEQTIESFKEEILRLHAEIEEKEKVVQELKVAASSSQDEEAVGELKATIQEIESNNEQTIESFKEEMLRLNAEIEEKEKMTKEVRSEANPASDQRITELEEELQTLTQHAKAADEWMQTANDNFQQVVSEKDELEKFCEERKEEIKSLLSEKNQLEERMRGLELSMESMLAEKAAPPPPPTSIPTPSTPSETEAKETLLEKLATSEKQRASLLDQLADEKERNITKLSALAKEVEIEFNKLKSERGQQ